MLELREFKIPGYETVAEARDAEIGYHAFLAIHSTRLGPAVGGTRFLAYPSEAAAMADALRLAEGMTFKVALAGIPLGGGKSVMLKPSGAFDRAALFRAHGRAVEAFGGRYTTAEDVGTSVDDMEWIAESTSHVAGRAGGMGDPGPFTARGVLQAMQAVGTLVLDRADLRGVRVAVQGAGNVGRELCRQLIEEGAVVTVADIDSGRAAEAVDGRGTVVSVDEIHAQEVEIFAPCALGGTLHASTVPALRARAVVGAANNQLASPDVLDLLESRRICYVPDFLANAGGVLSGCSDLLGYSREECLRRIDGIRQTAERVLREARTLNEPPLHAALRMARGALAGAAA